MDEHGISGGHSPSNCASNQRFASCHPDSASDRRRRILHGDGEFWLKGKEQSEGTHEFS